MQQLQIIIHGKLKDTGYRYFIKQIARLHGIKGNVKCNGDNSIIINAEGNENLLKKFTELLRVGAYDAHIDNFETIENPFNNYKSFEMI